MIIIGMKKRVTGGNNNNFDYKVPRWRGGGVDEVSDPGDLHPTNFGLVIVGTGRCSQRE
jgi:hypothetical protein